MWKTKTEAADYRIQALSLTNSRMAHGVKNFSDWCQIKKTTLIHCLVKRQGNKAKPTTLDVMYKIWTMTNNAKSSGIFFTTVE